MNSEQSHQLHFSIFVSQMSVQCPCLPAVAVQMELSRRKVPLYVSMCFSSQWSLRPASPVNLKELVIHLENLCKLSLECSERRAASFIKTESLRQTFCVHDQTVMFNENALNVISEWIELFFVHAWIQYVYLFFHFTFGSRVDEGTMMTDWCFWLWSNGDFIGVWMKHSWVLMLDYLSTES